MDVNKTECIYKKDSLCCYLEKLTADEDYQGVGIWNKDPSSLIVFFEQIKYLSVFSENQSSNIGFVKVLNSRSSLQISYLLPDFLLGLKMTLIQMA